MTSKYKLYKTAVAKTSTNCCNTGEFVSLEYYCFADGKHWYLINGTSVCLPETQLERFCL